MCRRVYSLMRACGLTKAETEIDGWSIRRWPTPASAGDDLDAEILKMSDRADAGAQQVGRRMDGARREDDLAARNSVRRPFTCATTPTQRVPSNSSSATCVSVEIVRLGRWRVSGSR